MYDIPVFAPHKYCARYLEMSLTTEYCKGTTVHRWYEITIFMYHGIYLGYTFTPGYHGAVSKNCMGIPWYYCIKCFYPSFISSQLISWYLISLECLSSCKCTDYTFQRCICNSYFLRFILWTLKSWASYLRLRRSSRVQTQCPHFQTDSSFNFSFATSSCYSSSSSSSWQSFFDLAQRF